MKTGRLVVHLAGSALATLALVGVCQPHALAQDGHGHEALHQSGDKGRINELVAAVRDATRRFQDPNVAIAEGYTPLFGCVTGSSEGAMGIHFVNMSLVGDGQIDPAHPEIVLYEPLPTGQLRLTGADFLVIASQWNAANPAPPELMGQLFHFFESPNRFGLPEFYTLHVWAWKDNPQGTFANWNPTVTCDGYNPQ